MRSKLSFSAQQRPDSSMNDYVGLRFAALIPDFPRWGMTMLVPEYSAVGGRLWTVRRARASIRAGEVSVKELLSELGVLSGLSGSEVMTERREAVL